MTTKTATKKEAQNGQQSQDQQQPETALITVKGDVAIQIEEYKKELQKLADDYKDVVVSRATLEEAKKARKRLRDERYMIQRRSKATKDALNALKSRNSEIEDEFVGIIRPAEDKIDEGIKKIEKAKEIERAEAERKKREAEERLAMYERKVRDFNEKGLAKIMECKTVAELDDLKANTESYDISEENFGEKHKDAYMVKQNLLSKIESRRQEVSELEEMRRKAEEEKRLRDAEEKERKEKELIQNEISNLKEELSDAFFEAKTSVELRQKVNFYDDYLHTLGSDLEIAKDEFEAILNAFNEKAFKRIQEMEVQEKKQAEAEKLIREQKKRDEQEKIKKMVDSRIKLLTDTGLKFDKSTEVYGHKHAGPVISMKSIESLEDEQFKNIHAEILRQIQGFKEQSEEWVYELQDIKKVPAKYLSLNDTAIQEAIESGTRKIAGLLICQRKD